MAEDATKTLHLYIDQQQKYCKPNKKSNTFDRYSKNELATTVNIKMITFSGCLHNTVFN